MLELSGTTLIYIFKENNVYTPMAVSENWSKRDQFSLSFIQLWGMAAGHYAASTSSALKRPRWEFVGGRPTCQPQVSFLADWSPFSFTLWSNWIHQYGMVYCPGLRTGLWAVSYCFRCGVWSGHLTFSIHMWKSNYSKPGFWHKK